MPINMSVPPGVAWAYYPWWPLRSGTYTRGAERGARLSRVPKAVLLHSMRLMSNPSCPVSRAPRPSKVPHSLQEHTVSLAQHLFIVICRLLTSRVSCPSPGDCCAPPSTPAVPWSDSCKCWYLTGDAHSSVPAGTSSYLSACGGVGPSSSAHSCGP